MDAAWQGPWALLSASGASPPTARQSRVYDTAVSRTSEATVRGEPSSVLIATARGPRTVALPSGESALPASAPILERLRQSARGATLGVNGASATKSMSRAAEQWRWFASTMGAQACAEDVCAWIMLRCAPPIGTPLPHRARKIVSAQTAVADVHMLRRHLRTQKLLHGPLSEADRDLYRAVKSPLVRALSRQIVACHTVARSRKLPVLCHMARDRVSAAGDLATIPLVELRNLAMMVVGLSAGLRRGEVAALLRGHIEVRDAAVWVAIAGDKMNRSSIGVTQHRPVPISNSFTVPVVEAYLSRLGPTAASAPLFPRFSDGAPDGPIARATVGTVISNMFPGATAHSLRVGFATELYARDVPLRDIMELGRWSSLASLLYVLPEASRLMRTAQKLDGESGIRFDSFALLQSFTNSAEAATDAARATLAVASPGERAPKRPARARAPAAAAGAAAASTPDPSSDDEVTAPCEWCGVILGAEEGWLCDVEPCAWCLCDDCWPMGARKKLRCPKHGGERAPPPESSARCDGTRTHPRVIARRRAYESRLQDEANEAEARRLLHHGHRG